MNRSFLALLPVLGAVVLLSACDQAREALGKSKRSPDEFAVYQRAPLSLPPNYGLRPPAPGADRPVAEDPTAAARQAVLGTTPQAAPRAVVDPNAPAVYDPAAAQAKAQPAGSAGLQVLLRETGAIGVDPNIRSTINRETTIMAEEDQTFADRIMTWGKPVPPGTVVNPEEEAKRIQANQALGRPITEGETPIIERKDRGLLEGLF